MLGKERGRNKRILYMMVVPTHDDSSVTSQVRSNLESHDGTTRSNSMLLYLAPAPFANLKIRTIYKLHSTSGVF